MCPPTEKQMRLIANMEQLLDVKFTGKTIRDASQFIGQHLEKYKEEQEAVFDLVYNVNHY